MTRIAWVILLGLVLVVAAMGGYFVGRAAEQAAQRRAGSGGLLADVLGRVRELEEQSADLRAHVKVLAAQADDQHQVGQLVLEKLGGLEVKLSGLEAASQPPLVVCSFDDDLGGWFAPALQVGDIKVAGELELTKEPDQVKLGAGAAVWSYEGGLKLTSAVTREVSFKRKLRAISFWVKSQNPMTLLIELAERDESKYHAIVGVVAGQWQQVERSVDQFQLSDDSQDENGELDADRIMRVTLIDVSAVLGQNAGPNMVCLDQLELQ